MSAGKWVRRFRQLACLLDLGFTPAEAAARMTRRAPRDRVLADLCGSMERGATLGEALAGERSLPAGLALCLKAPRMEQPAQALRRFAEALERREANRRYLKLALAYPGYLLLAFLVVGWILFGLLGRPLTDYYTLPSNESLEVHYSLPTRIAMTLGKGLTNPVILSFLILAAGFLGALAWCFPWWDSLLLRAPLAGNRMIRRESVCWLEWLSLGLRAGLPVAEASRMAAQACACPAFRRATLRATRRLEQGATLGQALERHPFFFPLAAWLVGRAEEREFPPGSLERIAGLLSASLRVDEERGLLLLEPLAIMLLGFLCLAFLLAWALCAVSTFEGAFGL